MRNETKKWLIGLFSALIGGGANSITVIVIDPMQFNFGEGLKKLCMVAIVGGILAGAAYLKQQPMPTWDGVERRKGG